MEYSSFIVLTGILWLFLAVYVSSEASKEGRSSPFWFLFTLIFGIIAVLLWAGRANKGYTNSNDNSKGGGKSSQIKSIDINLLRIAAIVIVLAGIFCVVTGLLSDPKTEYVEVCEMGSVYMECHMEKQMESTGGARTLLGVILIVISIPLGFYIQILKSKMKRNKTDQLNQ